MKTAPIEVSYVQHCGSDLTVVNAARVSFNKESEWEWYNAGGPIGSMKQRLSEKDTKLIHYLANHGHTSPFNHSFLTVRVKAPIFVARQLVKHKFMPWNEVSRRYVDEEPEFYFPDKWRARAVDKKQGSSVDTIDKIWWIEDDSYYSVSDGVSDSVKHALRKYNKMVENGVCPEQARMVLPQNTMTEWYWSGTLGAFCAMLNLRLKPDTQEETREVAQQVASIVQWHFPISYEALVK